MEDLIYQSEVVLDLGAVEDAARSYGYQSQHKEVAGVAFLEIAVTPPPYPKIWQWVRASREMVNTVVRQDPERMTQHTSGAAYVIDFPTIDFPTIDFPTSTLPELAAFLKRLMRVYGGWVGMEDDGAEDETVAVYDATDIETIVEHPLFALAS